MTELWSFPWEIIHRLFYIVYFFNDTYPCSSWLADQSQICMGLAMEIAISSSTIRMASLRQLTRSSGMMWITPRTVNAATRPASAAIRTATVRTTTGFAGRRTRIRRDTSSIWWEASSTQCSDTPPCTRTWRITTRNTEQVRTVFFRYIVYCEVCAGFCTRTLCYD